MAIVLYGVGIHKATASGNLRKMKAMEKKAARWLAQTGDVAAALELLRLEIARLEAQKAKKKK